MFLGAQQLWATEKAHLQGIERKYDVLVFIQIHEVGCVGRWCAGLASAAEFENESN